MFGGWGGGCFILDDDRYICSIFRRDGVPDLEYLTFLNDLVVSGREEEALGAAPVEVYRRKGPLKAGTPRGPRAALVALGGLGALLALIFRRRPRLASVGALPAALLGTVAWGLAVLSAFPELR